MRPYYSHLLLNPQQIVQTSRMLIIVFLQLRHVLQQKKAKSIALFHHLKNLDGDAPDGNKKYVLNPTVAIPDDG